MKRDRCYLKLKPCFADAAFGLQLRFWPHFEHRRNIKQLSWCFNGVLLANRKRYRTLSLTGCIGGAQNYPDNFTSSDVLLYGGFTGKFPKEPKTIEFYNSYSPWESVVALTHITCTMHLKKKWHLINKKLTRTSSENPKKINTNKKCK